MASGNPGAVQVKALIEGEGRKAVLISGDIQEPGHCRTVIQKAVERGPRTRLLSDLELKTIWGALDDDGQYAVVIRFEPPRVCRRPLGLSHAAMAGCSSMA